MHKNNKSEALSASGSSVATPINDSMSKISAESWITDYAWISGLAGAIATVLIAYWYKLADTLSQGLNVFGTQLTSQLHDSLLAALVMITAVMLLVEFVRLWMRSGKAFFVTSPDLISGHYFRFFVNALFNYLLYLALLSITFAFYRAANEYGFQNKAPYYQPWFRFLELLWDTYLWLGLPYALVTRAVKHDSQAEQRELTHAFTRLLFFFVALIPPFKHLHEGFDDQDKKIARGLLVKMFFTPLMTVFFCDQFQHLVSNMGYVFEVGGVTDGLPHAISSGYYSLSRFNGDLFNISMALVFSIDVALAWCGYVVASRWVDNQTASAEPTMLGWIVCIVCYPPFQMALGLYFTIPGDHAVLQMPNQGLVAIFAVMMVVSYIIYMSATLWFGVRFSNLTNRGIIRKGPFAIVRHPAYASKNFAWWCVMFPYIVYSASDTGLGTALFYTLGLVFMTGFYYVRAITEERHLMVDPHYQAYCQQVKYRFIPGLI